jgi:hypothetical protein
MQNVSFSSDFSSEQEYLQSLEKDIVRLNTLFGKSVKVGNINKDFQKQAVLANFLYTTCLIDVPSEFEPVNDTINV